MKVRSFLGIVACLLLAAQLPGQVIITNVVPPLGGHGEVDYIRIYGGNFLPGGHAPSTLVVKFNNTASSAGPTSVVSSNEIDIADVPVNSSGFITVSINGGIPAASPHPFVYVATDMPYATNFSPTYASGSGVTVSGVHFQTAGVNGVTFNGVPGTSFHLVSDNQCTVNPPSTVTTGPLTIQSSLGSSHYFNTSNNVFGATNFFAQASITSFLPGNGRTGTNVILTGANFIGCSGITFGGVPASDFTISNNTTIRVAVPVGASSGKIVVSPPGNTFLIGAQSAADFKIVPSISNFTPGSGPTNTLVTVFGAGLNEKSPHPDVSIGGGTAVVFSTVSSGTLSFNVPANAASGPITITTTNGSVTSDQIFYLPAAITNLAPTNGAVGTLVRVQGNNFTNALAVAFNGVTASFVVTNNNNIGVIAPVGVQSGVLSVTTPFGTTNSTQLFYIAPTISDFAPTHGVAGTRVQINGNSFTNASAVAFNGIPAASFTVTNNSTLSAVVPGGATSGKITVTAPGGTGQSAADFVIDSADLGITATDSPDPVFIGSNLVYTITITNAGPITALNVRLTNTLSGSVVLKSASTTAGSLATNSNPIIGTLGDLANQGSATVVLTVRPTATGTINNIASIGSDTADPNPANNSVTTTTTVLPLPFLSITNLMSNDLVRISWPTPLNSFTLQSSTNLSTNVWTIDTTSRSVSGTNVSVIKTNLGIPTFYRLTN
jgi:uncharacterized repeat protein (TIGR01451 family)